MVIVHALEAFELYEGEAADTASAVLGKGRHRILLAFLSARGVCLVDTDASAFVAFTVRAAVLNQALS